MKARFRSILLFCACLALCAGGCKPPSDKPDEQSRGIHVSAGSGVKAKPNRSYPPSSGRMLALLVGCTTYDNLEKSTHLTGPGNDVKLMRQVLTGWPGFKEKKIVALSEDDGKKNKRLRPTRENIEREFRSLKDKATKGDYVVILLAGHGSQQPERVPGSEPDGLDETFLPADVGKWVDGKKAVDRAIVDDDLGVWLKAITDTGASVWVTVDACHSGTMTRGMEITREVKPEVLGVPAAEIAKATKQAEYAARKAGQPINRGGGPVAKESPFDISQTGNLVAIYACRSIEPTVETKLPDSKADYHGLLTFTLCKVLTGSKTHLTYKEVVQQIQDQYDAWGRTAPVPLVEGPDLDREVLGSVGWGGRSAILLDKDPEDGSLLIKAGGLHGLTEGTILEVYPLAGSPDADKLLGHVKITELDHLDARVKPCAHGSIPAPRKLDPKGRCRVVEINYGERRLKLAAAALTKEDEKRLGKKEAEVARKRLDKALQTLEKTRQGWVVLARSPLEADWLVRLEKDKVYLESSKNVSRKPGETLPGRFVEPAGSDDQLVKSLEKLCLTIAKATTLLSLAGSCAEERSRGIVPVDVDVEMIRYANKRDRKGTVVPRNNDGRPLEPGYYGFRVTNRGSFAVYVTLLFVDPNYGIKTFFPDPKRVEDNRLGHGAKPLLTEFGRLTANPPGRDHLVVIAVQDTGQPADFGGLDQPGLEAARSGKKRSAAMDTPLGQFLEGTFFGDTFRGTLTPSSVGKYSVRLLHWETKP